LWANPFNNHELCIMPGGLYLWETIVNAGTSVAQLQCVHIELLVAFVRNRRGDVFHPSFLVDLNPSWKLADLLFTAWADQLTPEVTSIWKLSARALLDDGLTRRLLKRRWWRYTRWRQLFGLSPDLFEALRISDPAMVFPEYYRDVEVCLRTDPLSSPAVHLTL
jgi:hypothetical protein